MLFTEGKSQEYERLMQERPCFDRRTDKTRKKRDCLYCLHYDKKIKKCGFERCIVFVD